MHRFIILSVLIILVFLASLSLAEIPRLINYQGMLTDNAGEPLNGDFDLFFRIYNAPSGGDKRWEENHPVVSVNKGLFNVILGSQSGGIYLDFSEAYWLEIEVNNDTMPERLQFTSVGYAYRSSVADYALETPPGSGSNWHVDNSVLYTNDYWGIARGGGAGNVLYGDSAHTHVNLGVACTTGTNGASHYHCVVGGGRLNSATNDYTTVGGGIDNRATGWGATIAGGYWHLANGSRATIGGGEGDTASADYATVAGGTNNRATNSYAAVGGGLDNLASGDAATVSGGSFNSASGDGATVSGGDANDASGYKATVSGGSSNDATGEYATVGGGFLNTASGNYSFAAGHRAKANHHGCFVWADSTDGDFSSTGFNEFAVRASGGIRVVADNSGYAGDFDNQTGGGDGLRAFAHVSNGNNWAAIYARNYGTSPAIYALASGDLAAYLDGAVYVSDSLHVVGNISKGGGGFKIDHPLDPANKYLYHSFVESPDMMNVYNGNVVLDGKGEARVELPEWFEVLNRDFRYQLTPIGQPGPNLYVAREISGSAFEIAGGEPGLKVSWQVTGIRQDPFAEKHRIPVEEEKALGQGGKYLHPDAYNLPETMGISYSDEKEKGR